MEKKFVGRGGIKLDFALEHFEINVKNKVCLDVGAAVGGFTDCLLQNGARKVYAVDTGWGQLDWKLRKDPRVVVMERVNILHLESLPERVDIISIDAGWTKLKLILPVVSKFLKENAISRHPSKDGCALYTELPLGENIGYNAIENRGSSGIIVALLKPQYEAEKRFLRKGVVVLEELPKIVEKVRQEIIGLGFLVSEAVPSPILGGGGNREFFIKIQQKT